MASHRLRNLVLGHGCSELQNESRRVTHSCRAVNCRLSFPCLHNSCNLPLGQRSSVLIVSKHQQRLAIYGQASESAQSASPSSGLNEFVTARQTAGSPLQGSQFVKALTELYPPLPCRVCQGTLKVRCDRCDGQGGLARGGYQKRNPLSLSRIIGSKWTAMERTFGWRHFRVHSKRKGVGKEWFLEMVATCDETSRFWVNAQNLKDRERWGMGWLQKVEIEAAQKGADGSWMVCKACKGEKEVACPSCSNKKAADGSDNTLDIIEV